MLFKQPFFDLLRVLPLMLILLSGSVFLVSAQSDDPQGVFYTGAYPNLLSEWGISDEDIQARIDAVWEQLFYGNDNTQRVYYPVEDDMAYMLDVNNADVRSEGMSYGMMIAVQMDKQEEFDRIWKWAKTYMYQDSGPYAGYFAWHNLPDGTKLDEGPAPDGETWFVTALFFAASRWGNGEGIYDYEAEANAILNAMLHKGEQGGAVSGMFDPEHKMVVFVPTRPGNQFTDPSYHTPHFYEIWARRAEQDNDFWYEAARVSRAFWHTSAHPETGLMPDYAEFTGEPHAAWNYGEFFAADAWRCAMNVALDHTWFAADPWQIEQTDRMLAFFYDLGIGKYPNRFTIDGTVNGSPQRSSGLIAMNATAALAASTDTKWEFIEEFWNTPIPSGRYRYYDGLLYFMALLNLSGNFQIYM
jgi:oligosaccharide reducing-end xylanase